MGATESAQKLPGGESVAISNRTQINHSVRILLRQGDRQLPFSDVRLAMRLEVRLPFLKPRRCEPFSRWSIGTRQRLGSCQEIRHLRDLDIVRQESHFGSDRTQ